VFSPPIKIKLVRFTHPAMAAEYWNIEVMDDWVNFNTTRWKDLKPVGAK
jgi:hypothetical protein